jgi:hypothetical protein
MSDSILLVTAMAWMSALRSAPPPQSRAIQDERERQHQVSGT